MIAMAHKAGCRAVGVVCRWPPMEAGPFRTLPACAYREFETDLGVDCPGFVEVQQLIGESGEALDVAAQSIDFASLQAETGV